jgi:hypothetical protein
MPLEAAQLLYTAKWLLEPDAEWQKKAPWNKHKTARGYKVSEPSHPMARWVRRSLSNYMYCVEYGLALSKEYTDRYGKIGAFEEHIHWLKANPPPNLVDRGLTPIPLVVNKIENSKRRGKKVPTKKESDMDLVVEAYRKLYIEDKARFATYKFTQRPEWLIAANKGLV